MPLPTGTTDFSQVERFADIEAGVYEGHIEYVRYREAQSEGKSDQLSVCLESDEEGTKGARVWQNLYFSQKALFRMAEFFDLFGITSVDWDSGVSTEEPFDLLDPDLSGEPVRFSVVEDHYNGKTTMKGEVVEWLGQKKAAPKAEPAAAGRRPSAGARRELR